MPRNPVPGDRIVIKGIGEGEVLEFKNNNVFVKSGLLKTRVKLSDIMILDKPKKKPVKTQHNVYRTSSRADADVKTEIDMRGETVDEALSELGLFIDRCVLNNIEEIRIIHGKGTGALRSAVTDYLKTHPNVSEYRLGRYGEGELCAAGGKSSRRRPRSHFPFRPTIGSYDRSGCLCFFVPYLGSICSGGAWSVEKA